MFSFKLENIIFKEVILNYIIGLILNSTSFRLYCNLQSNADEIIIIPLDYVSEIVFLSLDYLIDINRQTILITLFEL